MTEEPARAGVSAGVLAAPVGWDEAAPAERAALAQMRACAPRARGGPVYAGFPWSALFTALDAPESSRMAGVLRAALRALTVEIPPGLPALTVCAHPGLRDRLPLLAEAGITDVFWSHATVQDLGTPSLPGLRIHPFPALPEGDAPPPGEGPEGLFAFCPATSGGNTPRLWGAMAAGLIPVIPVEQAALPGLPALWRGGAVFHGGSLEDAALSTRLEGIAADPARRTVMRDALRQLWLLYGTGRQVHGLILRMIDLACAAVPPDDGGFWSLAGRAPAPHPKAARQVLRMAAGDLLLADDARGQSEAARLRPAVERARAALPPEDPARRHLDEVRAHRRAARFPRPGLSRGAAPAVFFLGPRGQRTPLAYGPLRRLAGPRIRQVNHPRDADLILTGWNRDLEDNRDLLAWIVTWRPSTKIAVISEEPLWDSLWSGGFAARDRNLMAGETEIPYRFLNHVNSAIFDFRRIPYFLLTADTYPARYATLIAGFAGLTPRALLARWRAAQVQAAFVCERREAAEYAARFPEQGLYGLSVYRSRIAALMPEGSAWHLGQGWPGTPQRRQDLPDWHLDKLARLHGRVRLCAAHENTLFRDYITEKPFDAFAVGAVPAVVAGPNHRLHRLIDPAAMLDTAGLAPDLAAARIAGFSPDSGTAEAWLDSAAGLVALFRDTDALIEERRRVVDTTLREIAALV